MDLVAVDTLRDEHTSQVPQSILERPLLNAFIVVCEVRFTFHTCFCSFLTLTQDTETYRSSVKKQIKDWHTSVLQRKNQEWLIIHIVRPDSKTTGARIFQVKATVLDKIRADFNVDKRDRCVPQYMLSSTSQLITPADVYNLCGRPTMTTQLHGRSLSARSKRVSLLPSTTLSPSARKKSNVPRGRDKCQAGTSVHISS